MLGAGLATAAALVGATLFPRPGDDFNQPAFLVVTGLTLALVVLTVGSELVLGGRDRTRAVPGTFAALAAVHLGVVVALLLGDSGATGYVTGAVAPPVAAVVLGGLVFVGELLDDTAGGGADSTSNLGVGVGLVVYGVAVAAAGWRLPSRHVSAMLGGAVALLGAEAVIVGGLLLQAFGGGSLLAPDSTAAPGDPFGGVADPTGDVAVAMVLGLLVCAGLLGLHAYTRFPGYAVLGVVGTVLVAWSGLFGLYVDSVLRWGAGIGVAGVLLAAGALLALGGGRRGIGPRLRQGVVRLPRARLSRADGCARAPGHPSTPGHPQASSADRGTGAVVSCRAPEPAPCPAALTEFDVRAATPPLARGRVMSGAGPHRRRSV